MQCTEIVTVQFVHGATSVFVANCRLVRTGCGSADRFLNRGSVFRYFVLAEGPSNGLMMAWKTMQFGTVVEKG